VSNVGLMAQKAEEYSKTNAKKNAKKKMKIQDTCPTWD